jgi:hypothetical protein
LGVIIAMVDVLAREAVILACIGFLIGGIDDLALDGVCWLGRLTGRRPDRRIADLTDGIEGRIAIFVPAWDEADVIGRMLATTLARFGDDDFRLYVGAYANDRATMDAVAAIAERDARVRLVINPRHGPTTRRIASTGCGKRYCAKKRQMAGVPPRSRFTTPRTSSITTSSASFARCLASIRSFNCR